MNINFRVLEIAVMVSNVCGRLCSEASYSVIMRSSAAVPSMSIECGHSDACLRGVELTDLYADNKLGILVLDAVASQDTGQNIV